MLEKILTNWKTSLAGLGALLVPLADIIAHGASADWAVDIPAIFAAIGLVAAKDGNVSGGSVHQ